MVEETDKIAAAVARTREFEEAAEDRREAYLRAVERVQENLRALAKLTGQLSDARQRPKRDRSASLERRLEKELEAKKAERDRRLAHRDRLAEEQRTFRSLAENCRSWLESGGLTVEQLEAGGRESRSERRTTVGVA